MQGLLEICKWLEAEPLGKTIGQSAWMFPAIESVHMFGIVAMVGSTTIMDMRLLGILLPKQPVSKVVDQALKWAWGAFIVMIVTGGLMFISEATRCYANLGFQIKVLLLILAGLNVAFFHFVTFRNVKDWETSATPFAAKFAGLLSVLLWFGIVAMGRWIAWF